MANPYRNLIDQAIAAERQSDYSQAIQYWREAHAQKPTVQTIFRQAKLFHKIGNAEQALAFFNQGLNDFPVNIKLLTGRANFFRAQKNWQALAADCQKLMVNEPDKPAWALLLAAAQERGGQYTAAMKTIDEAVSRFPDSAEVRQRATYLQLKYSEKPVKDDGLWIFDETVDPASVALGTVNQYLMELKVNQSPTKFKELLCQACQRWPEGNAIVRQLADFCFIERDWQGALDSYAKLQALNVLVAADCAKILVCCLRLNDEDYAREFIRCNRADRVFFEHLLHWLPMGFDDAESATKLLRLIDQELRGSASEMIWVEEISKTFRAVIQLMVTSKIQRPLIVFDDAGRELYASSAGSNEMAVVVFAGYRNVVGATPFGLLDHFFAAMGISTIFLRDTSGLLYQNGLASVADDFEGTVSVIKDVLQRQGVRKVYTLGTSGGGAGAMRYGVALNADGYLLFSPPSNLTTQFLADNSDFRARSVIRKLNRVLDPALLDFKSFFQRKRPGAIAKVFFGQDNPFDAAQANNLADIEGVKIHPLAGVNDHNVFLHMLGGGLLQTELKQLFFGDVN